MTRWTVDEDAYLMRHYGKQDIDIIVKNLGRSKESVRHRFYRISPRIEQHDLNTDIFMPEEQWILDRSKSTQPYQKFEAPGAVSAANLAPWKKATKRKGNAYQNTKTGFRSDIKLNVRSGWEANFCRILQAYQIPFEFEPTVFSFPVKRGNKAYRPDFYLPTTGEWIEIKGYLDKDSAVKLRRFKKYYPEAFANLTMIISSSSKAAKEFCARNDVPDVLFYEGFSKAFKSKIDNWEGK